MNYGDDVHMREHYDAARRRGLEARDPLRATSVVYFIQADIGDGCSPIKIGSTNHLNRRLAQLQSGSPYEQYFMGAMSGGSRLEHELHRQFREERRFMGEWFAPTERLRDFIRENARLGLTH